jgi:hypothetical protein
MAGALVVTADDPNEASYGDIRHVNRADRSHRRSMIRSAVNGEMAAGLRSFRKTATDSPHRSPNVAGA